MPVVELQPVMMATLSFMRLDGGELRVSCVAFFWGEMKGRIGLGLRTGEGDGGRTVRRSRPLCGGSWECFRRCRRLGWAVGAVGRGLQGVVLVRRTL